MRDENPPFTLEQLKMRCTDVSDCWEWAGTIRKDGTVPIIQRRGMRNDGTWGKQSFSVRILAYWHAHGARPKIGLHYVIVPRCGNPSCINPEHMKRVTRSDFSKASAGWQRRPDVRMKIALALRGRSKLSDDAVQEVRIGKPQEMAVKHGISLSYAYMIRDGEWRRDYSNPFAGLGA